MWTPKTSNKSNSNRVDTVGRTYMTPYSTSFGSSSGVSNESGGNNKVFHSNTHGSFTPYSPRSFPSRSSTNTVGIPSGGAQQAQGSMPSGRNTPHILTNELSQLSLGSSHGHSEVTKTGGPSLVPNKLPLVPNKGHSGHGFVSAGGSSLCSTGLANVPSPASGLNLSAPRIAPTPGSSYFGAPMPFSHNLSGNSHIEAPLPYSQSQNQYQDETGQFSYMRLQNDSYDNEYDATVGVNDFSHQSGYYSSASDPQRQPGGLNIGGFVDYNAALHQKEHLVQSQQNPHDYDSSINGSGFSFPTLPRNQDLYFHGSGQYQHLQHSQPPQQDHDSSINATRFSFPTLGNQDLHFHGSGSSYAYQHFQQPQPRLYNPLRGKGVIPAQGSQLGPDDYGLLGLLKILKGVNPEKTSLAIGIDPHSLGLDLNSLEPIHQKFASPWSDEPVKDGPKYDIPECYNSKQPPALRRSHFKKFLPAMLFYIFYSMPQDEAQLFAANELHDRGWCYHKELRMWFTRDTNSVPSMKNATYEVGSYILFDPNQWQTIRQDNVILYYEMIEERPTIPPER